MALASVSGYDRIMNGEKRRLNDFQNEIRIPRHLMQTSVVDMPFELPAFANPQDFVQEHFGQANSKMHFLKGTTTLAFIYEGKTKDDKGGIVVSVDSRASSGIYVSTSTVMKVLPITSHIVATMAGGAADCQFWMRVLAKQCRLYELQNKEKISVAAASKLLANLVYGYKGMGLSMGTMVAGFDKRGPSLYYVDNDGVRCKGEKFSVGSGSLNAMGVMDTFHKKQMSDAEAIDLGRRAIMHATFRDSGSGGGCNLFHITKEAGWDQKERLDVSDMYYKHLSEMKRELFEPKL